MAESASSRRAAKEAYLKALKDQKSTLPIASTSASSDASSSTNTNTNNNKGNINNNPGFQFADNASNNVGNSKLGINDKDSRRVAAFEEKRRQFMSNLEGIKETETELEQGGGSGS